VTCHTLAPQGRNGFWGAGAPKAIVGYGFHPYLLRRACKFPLRCNLLEMTGTTYSCVRIKKIRTASDARNAYRHGARERGAFGKSAVDLDRTHLNQHWSFDPDSQELELVDKCPDYRAALETRREQLGAKRPKNGVFGTEMMFTASPSLFKGSDGQIDNDQAKAWAKACLDLAQAKYPGLCVAARLDLDETTPHMSVFIMPVYEKTYSGEKRKSTRKPKIAVSHNKVFGGPDDLSLLQDWAADGLKNKGFGVERGRSVDITRAVNFRPDGKIYEKLLAMWKKLKKEKHDVDKRHKILSKIAGIFSAESHLLTNDGRNAIRAAAGLKPLSQASSSDRPPQEPDAQDQVSPAPRPRGM